MKWVEKVLKQKSSKLNIPEQHEVHRMIRWNELVKSVGGIKATKYIFAIDAAMRDV